MSKEFEYAAMRALANDVIDMLEGKPTGKTLGELGLAIASGGRGTLIVYPEKTPRKNPACIVLSRKEVYYNWSASYAKKGKTFYVFRAGDFNMDRARKEAAL